MKRIIAAVLSVFALSFVLLSCESRLNNSKDVNYNGEVYLRSEWPSYNLELVPDDEEYIGDFIETYEYGQELPWEVFVLNGEKNILYSQHAIWLRPGYSFPGDYGEPFSKAEFVVRDGVFDQNPKVTHLIDFESGVTLENIIKGEPLRLATFEEYGSVRLYFANHANIAVSLSLFGSGNEYYLSVREPEKGENVFYLISDEYLEALTAAVKK